VVTFTGFALGLWLFHSIELAVFSGFAGIAITGIADFGGSRLFRTAAVAAAALLGAALVTLGTVMATQPLWSQMVVMFSVVAAVAFARVMGGYALAGADAVTLFYLLASGSSAPTSALPARLAGVVVGGSLAAIVASVQRDRATSPELVRMLSQLISEAGFRLRRLVEVDELPIPTAELAVPITSTSLRQFIDQRPDRPSGPIPSQRAVMYLANDLERLYGLLTRLERYDMQLTYAQQNALRGLSARWAEAATLLLGARSPDVVAAPPEGCAGFDVVARFSLVTQSIHDHAASFAGSQTRGRGWLDTGELRDLLRHAGRRFRANITPSSVRLQDSVRLGVGLMVGVLTVHLLGLHHGFWVALATLSVIKSDAKRTVRSLAEAVAGTAGGLGIAAAVIVTTGSHPGWLAAALPLCLFAAFYAKGALSFLVGQVAFTVAVLVMFNLLAPVGWTLGFVRLEDVAAGALIGLVVGVLAWPRGANASIGSVASRLVEASSRYVVAALSPSGGASAEPGPTHRRQSALDNSMLADDAFADFLNEHGDQAGAAHWAQVISFGNRLRYAGDLLTAQREHTAVTPHTLERATAAAARLEKACEQLAASLRGSQQAEESEPLVTSPVDRGADDDRPDDDLPDDDRPDDGLPDDDLTTWIQDLAESACALLHSGHD